MYHANGFTHNDVYTMPVYLRKFYLNKLVEVRKEENKRIEQSTNNTKSPQTQTPNIPRKFKR